MREICEKILKIEKKLSYDERSNLELVRQIINLSPNILMENADLKNLFEIYRQILAGKTSDKFSNSLTTSAESCNSKIKTTIAINNLESNNSDSYLILPVFSNTHVFSVVVRRFLDNYRFTTVDKGFYNEKDFPYKDFAVMKENVEKIISGIVETSEKLNTHELYDIISRNSSSVSPLNVLSRKQRTNNCYIKNPEQAIQFAFATRNFKKNNFETLKNENTSLKWEIETRKIRQALVNLVIKKYPKISYILEKELEIYKENKIIRAHFQEVNSKNGSLIDYEKALFKVIGLDWNNIEAKNNKEVLLKCLEHVDYNTMKRYYKMIEKIIEKHLPKEFVNTCRELKEFLGYCNISYYFEYKPEFEKLNQTLKDASKIFPWVIKQLNYDYHVGYYNDAATSHFYAERETAIKKYEKAIEFYSFNPRTHLYKGKCHYINGLGYSKTTGKKLLSKKEFEQALNDFNKAIEIQPHFAEAMKMREICYKSMRESEIEPNDEKLKSMTY